MSATAVVRTCAAGRPSLRMKRIAGARHRYQTLARSGNRGLASRREHGPRLVKAPQLAFTARLEAQLAAHDEVFDRARAEDLAAGGTAHDARREVDGGARDVRARALDFAVAKVNPAALGGPPVRLVKRDQQRLFG